MRRSYQPANISSRNYFLLVSLLFFCGMPVCKGQYPSSTQKDKKKSAILLEETYKNLNASNILTGRIYDTVYRGVRGSQFFTDVRLLPGKLIYNNMTFEDIRLQYDTYNQLVIALQKTPDSEHVISLDSDQVNEFLMNGDRFISYQDSFLAKGIYQVLYEGQSGKLLAKREKGLDKASDEQPIFRVKNSYYMVNTYGTHKVNNKKTFLGAFNTAREMKTIIKENKLYFGKQEIETSLVSALTLFQIK